MKEQILKKTVATIDFQYCTGCGNCTLNCPKDCIQMLPNEEGFLYPYVDNNMCIYCGKCIEICPLNKKIDFHKPLESFCAFDNNQKIWENSASGGVATQLAIWHISEQKGVVIGCEMTEEHFVQHTIIDNLGDVKRISDSKYVQSDLNKTFQLLENILINKKKCLFFGTPCQIAALKTYLKSKKVNDSHLITTDIVCHGVPSPMFWKKCVSYYKRNIEFSEVKFRMKTGKPKKKTNFSIIFKKNEKKVIIPARCDAYYNLFLNCDTLRECCYQCPYAKSERISDITLGDCDSGSNYKHLGKGKAKSIVLLNTEKGKHVWNKINQYFTYTVLDLKEEIKVNHQLDYPTIRSEKRNRVYKDIIILSYEELNKKYAIPFSRARKIAQILENILPNYLYTSIIKIIR